MSNQKRIKLPRGCLIVAGVLATLCGGVLTITTLASIFTPAAAPVEHNDPGGFQPNTGAYLHTAFNCDRYPATASHGDRGPHPGHRRLLHPRQPAADRESG